MEISYIRHIRSVHDSRPNCLTSAIYIAVHSSLGDPSKWQTVSLGDNSTKWTAGQRWSGANYVFYNDRRVRAAISAIEARFADEQFTMTPTGRCFPAYGSQPSYEYNHLSSPPYCQQYGEPSSSLATAQQEEVPTKSDYFRHLHKLQTSHLTAFMHVQ